MEEFKKWFEVDLDKTSAFNYIKQEKERFNTIVKDSLKTNPEFWNTLKTKISQSTRGSTWGSDQQVTICAFSEKPWKNIKQCTSYLPSGLEIEYSTRYQCDVFKKVLTDMMAIKGIAFHCDPFQIEDFWEDHSTDFLVVKIEKHN